MVFKSQEGQAIYLLSITSWPALRPTQTPLQRVLRFFSRKWSGRGLMADYSPPPSTEIKNYCNYASTLHIRLQAPYTLSVKLSDFTVWCHTWRKNWVVLKGTSAGIRTVLSNRLSHRELRSSLWESHSFLSLHADTTMASSVFSNSFSRWASHDIFLFKYHLLLHILRFLFFFSDNIMADVDSKQQTTALFLSTIVTSTRRHTELTKKLTNLMRNLCCAENIYFSFSCSFLHS
jgi:hypothetical protein